MEVLLSKDAGFCFGVKRAVELLETDRKDLVSFGELIHNPDFTKILKEKGIYAIYDPKEAAGKAVVIRAHGIPIEMDRELRKYASSVIDGTCPFVKKVQNYASKYKKEGYKILILGEKEHPEVVGIISYAKDARVINDISDIQEYKADEKILFISQTTQNLSKFMEIGDFLAKKYPKAVIKNTICNATEEKQKSAIELAGKVDMMVVVGGKNSSNTTRLKEICEKVVETVHIENAEELEMRLFENKSKVGVTAGASTPDYVIGEVVNTIYRETKVNKREAVKC
jgi:4-hydroxy-3-methylbut-2-enyl diphosphate reductase